MSRIKIGLIGGTGLGDALGASASDSRRHEIDTPFGRPSDAILEGEWAGVPVFILSRHGPGHLINPSNVNFRANIFALKQLGCTHVLASGAVGSLREEFKPRDLVIPDQLIDKTYRRVGTFYDKAAVHVEFAEPFCPVLRRVLLESKASLEFAVHDRGCYVCMEGPAFSTRAESLMHRLWGGDLIGMTCMPEAKLAREAEMAYALVALVTDYDCWRQKPAGSAPEAEAKDKVDPHVLLKEIIANLQAATANAVELMRRAVERMATHEEELLQSPALRSLELAVWSDKSRIDREEVMRLAPLWGKYYQ
jgi:5'-methylthioadenosine phosphorylase